MNISSVSEYENNEQVSKVVNCENDAVGLVINDLVNVLERNQPIVYCPLCVSCFPSSVELENHLRLIHLAFLWELTTRSIRLDACPLCAAKFVGHHLVAKHALLFHGNVLVDAFFQKYGSTIKCVFCHSILAFKNILAHLEDWHALQFIEWFTTKFQIHQEGVSGLVNTTHSVRFNVDDLNEHLQKLQVNLSPKSILKTPESKLIKPPVRRGLTFSDEDKENQRCIKIVPPAAVAGASSGVFRSYATECGKCGLMFSNCKQLDAHIKKNHRKIPVNMLKRFYKCSQCGANFFKRSYLSKHIALHSISKFR